MQHYANLGHVLTVLEADAESDPPWTWYYARTPSGVESWIRGDLIRRTDAPVPVVRVDAPTGTYPVADNNLCNTTLFRPCQDGTDHDLWEAGYWANDRYDHWEHGGWNLDIVYHQNQCKLNRLCTTKEAWDAARVEAELLAASATPDVTLTPFGIKVTVEVEVPTVWVTLTGTARSQVLGRLEGVYAPPELIRDDGEDTSVIGEFRFDGNPSVLPANTGTIPIRLRVSLLNREYLPVRNFDPADEDDDYDADCVSDNIRPGNIVARQWQITLTRSYTGRGRIRNVSWRLTATYGREPDDCVMEGESADCKKVLQTANSELLTYLGTDRPSSLEDPVENLTTLLGTSTCEARTTIQGESTREVTRYEHTCRVKTGDLQHTLTLHYTHDKTRGLLPEPTPQGG